MAEQYNLSDEAIGGAVELGVVGTLIGAVPSLPPAMVTVATIGGGAATGTAGAGAAGAATGTATAGAVAAGAATAAVATPIIVSLTGVAAVSAAAYVGFSFGKRVVKNINHSLKNNPESRYSPATNN